MTNLQARPDRLSITKITASSDSYTLSLVNKTTLKPQSAIFNVHVFVSLHLEHSGSKGGLTSVTPCMWHCMVLYCFFISVAAKLHKIGLNIMQHLSVFGIIYQTLISTLWSILSVLKEQVRRKNWLLGKSI